MGREKAAARRWAPAAALGRQVSLTLIVLGALVVAVVTGATPSAASVVTPPSSYDTATYAYGAADRSATQDVAEPSPRGSSVGRFASSWEGSASIVSHGVAANSGGGGFLSRLRAINWADDTGSISLPGNRLRPNYAAEGPHSTFRTGPDRSVTHYATWEPQSNPLNPAPWQMVKRVDVVGDPHFSKVTGTYVDTPHVQGPSIPGGVRPAEPWELP